MPQFYAVEQGKKMRMVMNEPDLIVFQDFKFWRFKPSNELSW